MGKVKIKKKSTLIDMTAMSDVTVLLLTFFMLTSTFLTKEPTTVHTPSSVSVEAVPAKDLVTILVSSEDKTGNLQDPTSVEGRIFISFMGDSVISSEKLRAEVFKKAIGIYNKVHKNDPLANPTQTQMDNFAKTSMFGCSFKDLYTVLDMDPAARDKVFSDLANKDSKIRVGIPINGNRETGGIINGEQSYGRLNDFQIWLQALSEVAQENRDDICKQKGLNPKSKDEAERAKIREIDMLWNSLRQGRSISVKADKDTPFNVIHLVFDNLQTMDLGKFTLMTNLKNEGGN